MAGAVLGTGEDEAVAAQELPTHLQSKDSLNRNSNVFDQSLFIWNSRSCTQRVCQTVQDLSGGC